jgi:hypothetical protein
MDPREGKAGSKAWCEHRRYPMGMLVVRGGSRRAWCLKCGAVGPVCGDVAAAREALIATRSDQNHLPTLAESP